MPDHFGTLCIKGLRYSQSSNFLKIWRQTFKISDDCHIKICRSCKWGGGFVGSSLVAVTKVYLLVGKKTSKKKCFPLLWQKPCDWHFTVKFVERSIKSKHLFCVWWITSINSRTLYNQNSMELWNLSWFCNNNQKPRLYFYKFLCWIVDSCSFSLWVSLGSPCLYVFNVPGNLD